MKFVKSFYTQILCAVVQGIIVRLFWVRQAVALKSQGRCARHQTGIEKTG